MTVTPTAEVRSALDDVKAVRDTLGPVAATEVAGDYLQAGTITTGDYLYLVRWSEGRDARTTAQWLAGA